jgi:hypothetical protein
MSFSLWARGFAPESRVVEARNRMQVAADQYSDGPRQDRRCCPGFALESRALGWYRCAEPMPEEAALPAADANVR